MKDEEENKKMSKQWIQQYILPIVGVCIFVIIMFAFLIPSIFGLFSKSSRISELKSDVSSKTSELDTIAKVEAQSDKILSDLNVLNSVTPTGDTEVLSFADRIKAIATENSLTIGGQNISEQVNTSTNSTNEGDSDALTIQLREIPVNFELLGEFSDIINFSNQISNLEDFIIIKEMELVSSEEDNSGTTWSFILQFTKYQFGDQDSEEVEEIYLSVPITAEPGEIINEYIESKAGGQDNTDANNDQ